MAGLKGNVAWWAFGKQTAKGTPAANAAYLLPFTGGTLGPNQQTGQLEETDASRDQGNTYVQSQGIEGSPETYVRDASFHAIVTAVLGTQVDSGTTNYTHTSTPANALSYYTFWRMQGDLLWEKFEDCMVSDLTIRAEAGNPLTAALTIVGRKATRLTADPSGTWSGVTMQNGPVYNYNDAAVTLGGGATALVRSFELTIANNVQGQQTDDVFLYDVVPGKREVSLGFDLIFETLDEYNKFLYGGAAGTTPSPTIYTTSADFTFTKGVNNSVQFTLPSIAYEQFPVAPNAGGDPIVVSVRAQAQRGGSPVVTAVTKNQVAT